VAPARGGTSGHKLLTVPAFGSPVRVSVNRQEIATARTRIRARMEVDALMFTSGGNWAAGDPDYRPTSMTIRRLVRSLRSKENADPIEGRRSLFVGWHSGPDMDALPGRVTIRVLLRLRGNSGALDPDPSIQSPA
jgi:hypothetical protein